MPPCGGAESPSPYEMSHTLDHRSVGQLTEAEEAVKRRVEALRLYQTYLSGMKSLAGKLVHVH
jgi:hypothetical protein